MPAHPIRRILPALAAVLLAGHPAAPAQTTAAPATAPTSATAPQIPLSHLYLHFFLYESHLEHLEEAHPTVNPKGKPLKEHLRLKTGLSQDEWKSVAASSLRMESAHKSVVQQVNALVESDRVTCKASATLCTAPPSLTQIKTLQQQHQQALDAEIKALETSLGPDSTAKFQAYLKTDLATHIKLTPVSAAQVQASQAEAVAK